MKKIRFPQLNIYRRWLLPVVGVLAIVIVFGLSSPGKAFIKRVSVYFSNVSSSELSSKMPNFWLPSGRETYQIVQAAGADPKIIEATIDPPDVHVGDNQKLSIVVASEDGIESVVAKIETDNGIKELPLKFVKKVSWSELQPVKYAVSDKSELVFLNGNPNIAQSNSGIFPVAEAHSPDEWDKLLYEASWKVKDTHDKKYHTTFVVKNSKGQENSITLAWSDACAIPVAGAWNLASYGNCIISTPDGVEIGGITIQSYTLTLNSTFAFNPGYSISVSSGAIAMGTGGSIVESYIWTSDSDGDGYAGSNQTVSASSPGGGWNRRANWGNSDCDDGNGYVFQSVGNLVYDEDGDSHYTAGPATYCVGSTNPSNIGLPACAGSPSGGIKFSGGWYRDDTGGYNFRTTNPTYDVFGDCNSSCSQIFQNVSNIGPDGDSDTFPGSRFTYCVGSNQADYGMPDSYSDYYGTYLTSGYEPGITDCDDGSSNVFQIQNVGTDRNNDGHIQEGWTFNVCVGGDGYWEGMPSLFKAGSGTFCWRGWPDGYNQNPTIDGNAYNGYYPFGCG